MLELIWKEKNPLRGSIRRGMRSLLAWSQTDGIPALVVIWLLVVMSIPLFHALGERLAGPVPAAHIVQPSTSSHTSLPTGRDPVAEASRADHGLLTGGVR